MKYLLLLQCLTAIVFVAVCGSNRPPSIYLQSQNDIYYNDGDGVQLQCEADGVPNPKYNWTKNEKRFDPSGNDDRIVQVLHTGTILITRADAKDEGIYQCLAYNDLGVSTSINVNVRQAMLKEFPHNKEETIHAILGHSVKLFCTPPESIPKAEVQWVLRDNEFGKMAAIMLSDRIKMDLEGNLYITNVLQEDYQNGRAYVCIALNYAMRSYKLSHGTVIIPTGTSDIKAPPHYMWSNGNVVIGILGQSIRMQCIYGGNPTPVIYWESETGKTSDNRWTLSRYGQELSISELKKSDNGNYTCTGISEIGIRQQRNISLIVKSKPYWLAGGEPQDIETSVGSTANFTCRPGGDPAPTIQWYINGVRFHDASHITISEGRLLKPNDNEIIIVDLRLSDAMVLQCNASNTYGYVFADFYLNVLSKDLSAGVIGQ